MTHTHHRRVVVVQFIKQDHLYLYKIESLIFAIFVSNDLRNGKAQPYISYTGGFSLMSRWFLAHQLVNLSYVGPITET